MSPCKKACMRSKFSQIQPLVSVAQIGLEWRHTVFSNVFDRIHFILAGNNDMYKSLNEFEIWRDPTMDYRFSYP